MPRGKPTGKQLAKRRARKLEKEIEILIGPVNGETTIMMILAGDTVRDVIRKYEDTLEENPYVHRLLFESKVLYKSQVVLDVGIVTQSQVFVIRKETYESDSDSSGPPDLIGSDSSN